VGSIPARRKKVKLLKKLTPLFSPHPPPLHDNFTKKSRAEFSKHKQCDLETIYARLSSGPLANVLLIEEELATEVFLLHHGAVHDRHVSDSCPDQARHAKGLQVMAMPFGPS